MLNRRQFIKGLALTSCASVSLPMLANARVAKEPELFSETRLLMGTIVNLKAVHTSKDFVFEVFDKAFLSMQEAEAILTRHDGASALSVLNTQKTLKDAPEDLICVAKESQKIEQITAGAFNPSVLPVLELLEQNLAPTQAQLSALYPAIKNNSILLSDTRVASLTSKSKSMDIHLCNTDTKITFDGIAKGYIIDKAVHALTSSGLQDFLVNAGGDMYASGMKNASLASNTPWRVAIEDPKKQGEYPAILPLYNSALATSGSYEKTFGTYNHLIIPQAQEDTTDICSKILSVSVKAKNAMLADAFATALSCMPVQTALDFCATMSTISCLIIAQNGAIQTSKNWNVMV